MNGPHDMGGMQCYGAINPEVDEPVFHGEWEKRALALTVAMGFMGFWNLDASRFSRESLPPIQYLSYSYYQIWLAALEKLMLQRGLIAEEELTDGKVRLTPVAAKRHAPDRGETAVILKKGGPTLRSTNTEPAYSLGDQIRTIADNPNGHTRLPRYARGKIGTVIHHNGAHVFPDTNAKGEGENPEPLYTVEFTAQELFGSGTHRVTLDLWEPYLTHA